MNRAALFLNGQAPSKMPALIQYDKIYCTDGAYTYLMDNLIMPDVITGDFDSISINPKDLPKGVEVINTPDQNFTDFEKALQILEYRGFEEVHIYGSSGMEHDHFLGNLTSGLKFNDKMTLIFFDDYSYYFFAEKELNLSGYKGRVISLYPFPKATRVTVEGLEFPLNNETLDLTDRIGIRNLAIEDNIKITFEEGNLLVFIKRV